MRRLSIIFGVVTIALFGLSAFVAMKPPPDSLHFVIDECDRDLRDCAVGDSILTFRITNPTDRPGRIIGLVEG